MMNDVMRNFIKLVSVRCCVCDTNHAKKIGSGYDFEYMSCADIFDAYRCEECGNVYLSPRPDVSEFNRIYPLSYHSLDFSEENYSVVHKVRLARSKSPAPIL